jgi:small-conductance mechanosensitive channel
LLNLHNLVAGYLTPEHLSLALRIVLILAIGYPLVKLFTKLTGKMTQGKLSPQSEMLLKRFVYYSGALIIVISVLNELGFKLSALLGAAGVFGIAIGFASQTSISNIISGIFLISEKPFTIGDSIQIGKTSGTVLSIDLLSIKVQTSDNRYVRIPNENMIKTEIINLTRFDVRRVTINFNVSYADSLPLVSEILLRIAHAEPLALTKPEPVVLFEQFAENGISIMFGVWGKTANQDNLRNALLISIKDSFAMNNISFSRPGMEISNQKEIPLQIESIQSSPSISSIERSIT